ncbi:MAG TPA: hypothetical protein VH352_21525, partial [Pseudonocardiaceae bacterium]|nr:hypothetical protein [Pseudonocardiaceae bacterium]
MTGARDRARLRERLAPGHPMHVHAAAVRLHGPLDESRLRAAVRDDVTIQVVPDGDVAELARAPFDLTGSLWRVLLVRRDPREHMLVVAAHQAAADERTVALALAEVGWRYSDIPVA